MGLEQKNRALCTDLYELTMAAAYFELGMRQRAAFELFTRELPRDRGYLLCAGLEQVVSYLRELSFSGEQIDYLRGLEVFEGIGDGFFEHLTGLRFTGDLFAMPEGTLAFADEPLLRVEADMIEAQIVETFLLSMVNYQTLVATKAARVVQAARSDGRERAVVDFGSRRAHGPDAGVLAARASCIGGCRATSNVEAGFQCGIPVAGTEAHSFIMSFEREEDAFRAYYDCFGRHTILLIDTYDTLEGARRAARAAPEMRGVRLDSGDMAELSTQVRRVLDDAGRTEAMIFASSELDEHVIADLLERGAAIDGFGVGTRLVVSEDDPSLGGVYKLVAVEQDGRWDARMKLSSKKATYPGLKQVQRFSDGDGGFARDVIATADEPCPDGAEALLVPVLRDGEPARGLPSLEEIRQRAAGQLRRLPQQHRRLRAPEPYPVEISEALREKSEQTAAEIERSTR